MCWFFHKWGKWTKLREIYHKYPHTWHDQPTLVGYVLERICGVCDKPQLKRDYSG